MACVFVYQFHGRPGGHERLRPRVEAKEIPRKGERCVGVLVGTGREGTGVAGTEGVVAVFAANEIRLTWRLLSE